MGTKEGKTYAEEAAVDERKFENVQLTVQSEPSAERIKSSDFCEEGSVVKETWIQTEEKSKSDTVVNTYLYLTLTHFNLIEYFTYQNVI